MCRQSRIGGLYQPEKSAAVGFEFEQATEQVHPLAEDAPAGFAKGITFRIGRDDTLSWTTQELTVRMQCPIAQALQARVHSTERTVPATPYQENHSDAIRPGRPLVLSSVRPEAI